MAGEPVGGQSQPLGEICSVAEPERDRFPSFPCGGLSRFNQALRSTDGGRNEQEKKEVHRKVKPDVALANCWGHFQ